jgi:hypothetical protein
VNTLQQLLLREYHLQRSFGADSRNARETSGAAIARRFAITRAHALMELDAALAAEHSTPVLMIC